MPSRSIEPGSGMGDRLRLFVFATPPPDGLFVGAVPVSVPA